MNAMVPLMMAPYDASADANCHVTPALVPMVLHDQKSCHILLEGYFSQKQNQF